MGCLFPYCKFGNLADESTVSWQKLKQNREYIKQIAKMLSAFLVERMEVNTMIELKDLLEEGEVIVEYHLHNEYWSRNCITEKGSTDCSGALEMTLHRILEAGGTETDVYRIMGAKIPTDEELKELEEFDEFVWIDLGYVLPGLIDMWEEKIERMVD